MKSKRFPQRNHFKTHIPENLLPEGCAGCVFCSLTRSTSCCRGVGLTQERRNSDCVHDSFYLTIWIRPDETWPIAIDGDPPGHKWAIGKMGSAFPAFPLSDTLMMVTPKAAAPRSDILSQGHGMKSGPEG